MFLILEQPESCFWDIRYLTGKVVLTSVAHQIIQKYCWKIMMIFIARAEDRTLDLLQVISSLVLHEF